MSDKAREVAVPVSVFFDYACPFSHIASARLEQLAAHYPLALHWRFIETRSSNTWSLDAAAEASALEQAQRYGVPLNSERPATGSRPALLLAQAVLDRRPERFWDLHHALLRVHFVQGHRLDEADLLGGLARQLGVEDLAQQAWHGPEFLQRLLEHVEAAQQLGVSSVPTLVLDNRRFAGLDAVNTLEQALAEHYGSG